MRDINQSKIIYLRFYIFLSLIFSLSISLFGQSNNHLISRTTTVIDGGTYAPGDTIFLLTGPGGLEGEGEYFLFRNIHGTSSKPIVIINSGGQVKIITSHNYGIKFQNCSYIKMSGAGHSSFKYGIKVSHVENGAGLSIDNLSTDVELENLEISNTPIAGIVAKTEPSCDLTSVRGNFTMYNIKIHDCYLHDIGTEGFYIGSSKYTGQAIVGCDTLLPHVIEGVQIYNNIVENTGWDGIQVSSTTKNCAIYNNIIRNDSYKETQFQMSGILIGGGSSCDCYNNMIFDGKGDGIDILGFGNHKIYNNLIVRAGKSYQPSIPPTNPDYQKHGIWVGHVDTKANSEFLIYNNTIVSPKTYGLKLTNTQIGNYIIKNNIIVDPGAFSVLGESSFMNLISDEIRYQSANNLFKSQISDIQFQNSIANNFDLKNTSPAVNTGQNLSSYNLTFDILNRPRPYGSGYDIGAYECQESINGIGDNVIDGPISILQKVAPNPVNSSAAIQYDLPKPMQVNLYVVDELGRVIKKLVDEYQPTNTYQININKEMFNTGLYFLILDCDLGRFTEKFIII
ncbi:MAG: hypothetical protein CVU00_03170 [Bacteroidetes bacterium HGW-Bacteroidetes-17]|jgi:hypothetical protein|nr:MAG: hypothetical protein CVU00_03170 [Bacteroidetes bacterium HGW-Bacteroidetes-17]